MDVDAAQGGDVQHPLGQNPAIGHHRAHIGPQGAQGLHRLVHNAVERLDLRAGGVLHGPDILEDQLRRHRAGGHHAVDDLKAVGKNLFQALRRNVRRAHENHTHGIPPFVFHSMACSSSSERKRSMTSV